MTCRRYLALWLIALLLAAIDCAYADSASGPAGQLTLAPGLCSGSSCSSYNPGTQTLVTGQTVSQQLFVAPVSTGGTQPVTGADAGKLWIPTVAGVTFSVPAPGPNGTFGLNFGYDGTHGYSITSPAQIYGCGTAGTTISVTSDASLTSDGTNWKCSP